MSRPDLQKIAEERFLSYLKKEGARKTPERMSILKMVYEMEGHFEVEELFRACRIDSPGISLATVYNTLELFLDAQLVMKLQFGDARTYYERLIGAKQHDHLMCNQCHQIIEFCAPSIQPVKTQMGEVLGFDITRHALTLHGDCMKEDCPNRMLTD